MLVKTSVIILDMVENKNIPVSPNNVPPSGCPKHWIKSTEECTSPTSSSVCSEFCPNTRSERAHVQQSNLEALGQFLKVIQESVDQSPTPLADQIVKDARAALEATFGKENSPDSNPETRE